MPKSSLKTRVNFKNILLNLYLIAKALLKDKNHKYNLLQMSHHDNFAKCNKAKPGFKSSILHIST